LVLLTIAGTAATLWLSRYAFDIRYDPWQRDERSRVEVSV
jgi:hypothetical protein